MIEMNSNLLEYLRKICYTKDEVDEKIASVGFHIEIVDKLPSIGENGVLYLLKSRKEDSDVFEAYVWVVAEKKFQKIGTTDIDFSNYYTKKETDAFLSLKANKELVTYENEGLMSSDDKIKLDGVYDGATKTEYIPTCREGTEIGKIYINEEEYTIYSPTLSLEDYYTKKETDALLSEKAGHNLATHTSEGLMGSDDKIKLDGIHAEANNVKYEQILKSGKKIGTIIINDKATEIFAPSGDETGGDDVLSLENAVFMSDDGSDEKGNGSLANPYGTLEKAIHEIGTNGIVYILSGSYTVQNVKITKPCTLHGLAEVVFDAKQKNKHLQIRNDAETCIVKNIMFVNGKNESDAGSIYIEDGEVHIENCTFKNNASLTNAGAVGNFNDNDLTIKNSVFEQNTANTNGGAVYSAKNGELTIKNCKFKNNVGEIGGALCSEKNMTVLQSIFKNNKSSLRASSIMSASANISHCIFKNEKTHTNTIVQVENELSLFHSLIVAEGSDSPLIYKNGFIHATVINNKLIDLNNYYTKNEIDNFLLEKADKELATHTHEGLMSSNDKIKLDSIYEGATKTTYEQEFKEGTKIGTITINNEATDLFAPGDDEIALTNNSVFLSPNGSDKGDGDLMHPFKSFEMALSKIKEDGVIYLLPGVYTEVTNVQINKSCTIQGIDNVMLNAEEKDRHMTISTHSQVKINNITFKNGKTTGAGGSVYVVKGAIEINNCIFQKNNSIQGGAISSGVTQPMTIKNSVFFECSATKNGGALYSYDSKNVTVFNSKFEQCTAGNGGAMFCVRGKLDIQNITCSDIHCEQDAGCIYLDESTVMTLENSKFTNTTAKGNGGVIYSSKAPVSVRNCDFSKNEAEKGGAIYQNGKKEVNIHDSTFSNTTARDIGGAVYTTYNIQIYDSFFEQTHGGKNAGAIGAEGQVLARNSTFQNCSTRFSYVETYDSFGGAIRTPEAVIIIQCAFKKCESQIGGAIYTATYCQITQSVFENCLAAVTGGAVDAISYITADTCSFLRCNANKGGGGLHAHSDVLVTNSTFDDCKALSGVGNGGSIFASNSIEMYLTHIENDNKYERTSVHTNGCLILYLSVIVSALYGKAAYYDYAYQKYELVLNNSKRP